jgi:hypothetical protein
MDILNFGLIKLKKFYFTFFYGKSPRFNKDMSIESIRQKFKKRQSVHKYACNYFKYFLPEIILDHRLYFTQNKRGFGEDALHSMWWIILREYKPKKCLEIGVYRGQVISLWALIARELNFEMDIFGLSPFDSSGDQVSQYIEINYIEDIKKSHNHFSLKHPNLIKGYSTDLELIQFINTGQWDLVYIDGGHDYDVVKSDYQNSLQGLKTGGILVFDDSSLYTDYKPTPFSFAGHPGPSRVVNEISSNDLEFLFGVGHNNVFRKK